jgi:hypothetical protein
MRKFFKKKKGSRAPTRKVIGRENQVRIQTLAICKTDRRSTNKKDVQRMTSKAETINAHIVIKPI